MDQRNGSLSRQARRLLEAAARPGAACRPDPEAGAVVVSQEGGRGISLARGTHPLAAAEELVGIGAAVWSRGEPRRLLVEETGRALLRRLTEGSDAPFRDQHGETGRREVEVGAERVRVAVNLAESPLDWLRRRKDRSGEPLIDAAEYEAGERLRRDLTAAGMLPSVTAKWDGAVGGGGAWDPAAATNAVVAARQRADRAMRAVGADFANLLVDLCGFLKGLETIEREHSWPPRSGKVVARLALRRLAEHYGLQSVATGRAASSGIRAWSAGQGSAVQADAT